MDTDADVEILEPLATIARLLRERAYPQQADFIEHLIELQRSGSPDFGARISGVEMWGGSGSVRDVVLPDRNDERRRYLEAIVAVADYTNRRGVGTEHARARAERTASTFRMWLRKPPE